MKQRICISPVEGDDKEEMQVAAIILELRRLIKGGENKVPPLPTWGSKRKRSINLNLIYNRRSLSLPLPPVTTLEPPSLPPPQTVVQETDESKTPAVKGEASSPATPLTFNPSEYDEKPNRVKRKLSVKKTKQQLLQIIKECTQRNELLTKNIEQAKLYNEQLKERNLLLQTRKQELSCNTRREKLEVGITRLSNGLAMADKPSTTASDNGVREVVDERPIIRERIAANEVEMTQNYAYSYGKSSCSFKCGSGLDVDNKEAKIDSRIPGGIGEAFLMEVSQHDKNKSYSKILAAQARQRRMQICRDKSSNSNVKLRIFHKQ